MMRRRLAIAAAIWLGPSLFFLAIVALTSAHFRIASKPVMDAELRQDLLACLREGLGGESLRARASLQGKASPIVVRIYAQGRLRERYASDAPSWLAACREVTAAMAADSRLSHLGRPGRTRAMIRVDRITGVGALLESPSLLAAMALHPTVDGLGVRLGDQTMYLLPSELVDKGLFTANRPLAFVPDLAFGFDRKQAEPILRERSGLDERAWQLADKRYFRFQVESFVESEDGGVLPLERDLLPAPALSVESLRAGALAGGRYLVAHLAPSGRYIYNANLSSGRQSSIRDNNYSLPRHAGTTYFLAELYRVTGESFLLEPIERAIGHLVELVESSGCRGISKAGLEFSCVSDRRSSTSDLGSTALAVVALAEYQRATGSSRYQPLMLELSEFLLHMQRADGSFAHRYNWKRREIDDQIQLLYYSGEASLALARVHLLSGQERYLRATEGALDSLVHWYDFFLGGFFYGEEHWTCIAAEAAYPALDKASYLDFCEGYGRFLRRNQPQPGTFQDQAGWAGAYYFTPFLAPQNTPAGSRSEAMISTYTLGLHHGKSLDAVKKQVLDAMRYALTQQVRADGLFRVPRAVSGLGAIPGGPIDRTVRIDYVQHVCSAMLRSAALLGEESSGGLHRPR